MNQDSGPVAVNGRPYAKPIAPTVVVCVDGCEPDYLTEAMAAGRAPYLRAAVKRTPLLTAEAVLPSFTNPNNTSIITGVPPAVHGIAGNYFLDRQTGQETMMNDPVWLRAETIPAVMEKAGVACAVVTAKDKLRRLLGAGFGGICFSAEQPAHPEASGEELAGQAAPEIYSARASLFVLDAGLGLIRQKKAELIYLSLTDYIQHKYAPDEAEALDFYTAIDRRLAALDDLGAIVALTADHGMKPKTDPAGRPRIVFLQTELDRLLGPGRARVILPITDPYTVHHGSLGSLAMVYLTGDDDPSAALAALPGIESVVPRTEAADRHQLPPDRIGDFLVVSKSDWVIGTRAQRP